MQAAVIVFPGSNCDRDVKDALTSATGNEPQMIWHQETELPDVDLVVLPGGFSYGDYLRSGAIAARSPIMEEVVSFATKGRYVLGICNGFQLLTECGLLPGSLMRNHGLNFISRDVYIRTEEIKTVFAGAYEKHQVLKVPVAHHDGCYYLDEETFKFYEDRRLIAFRYCERNGEVSENANPNGSVGNIAGIYNKGKNVLGMMPHPERCIDKLHGGTDGLYMFHCLSNCLI